MSELHSVRDAIGQTTVRPQDTDAANTGLPSETIDAIITSPPYCGSQKYIRSMKLELIISGHQLDEIRSIDKQTLGTEAITGRNLPLGQLLTEDPFADRTIRQDISRETRFVPIWLPNIANIFRFLRKNVRRVLTPGGQLLVTLGQKHPSRRSVQRRTTYSGGLVKKRGWSLLPLWLILSPVAEC